MKKLKKVLCAAIAVMLMAAAFPTGAFAAKFPLPGGTLTRLMPPRCFTIC